jgi:hypothetical protein
MQEHSFIPEIGMSKKKFWDEVNKLAKENEADNILMYMYLMLKKAEANGVRVLKTEWEKRGQVLKLFDGVTGWFDRINVYGKEGGVQVEHFIISSGIREMVEGTPIAEKFRAIFASSFFYNHNGVACWPALALNYTTKTQYLFRINKGSLSVHDHTTINEYVPKAERAVPFENQIYIGDGETDIPCFRLIKDQGGHSIAVYKPSTKGAKNRAEKLIKDGRVNFSVPADYTDGFLLDRIVKSIIDKLATDNHLRKLGKKG